MFSLQKLLGKEDQLLTLMEASAAEACASVQALSDLGKDVAQSGYARHRDRQITTQITEAVYTTFVTAIQREEILALSFALYRIAKTADKVTERALLAPHYLQGVDFSNQIEFLNSASDIVLQLVQSLRAGLDTKRTKALIDELQSCENQADKLLPGLYQSLYSGKYGAVQAIFLKDLYELLEKAIDRCRSAGNIVSRIVLRNA